MIVKSLSISNFLGYSKRCNLDFGNRKTIGIVGQNEAGKSSILMAIAYGMYGRIPNQGDTREVSMITSGPSTADMIIEEEVDVGGDVLKITRGRTRSNKAVLKLAGSCGGKPTDLDEEIEHRLKLPFNDFIALSYFVQGDIHQFLSGDKRSYFSRWAESLSVWDGYALKLHDDYTKIQIEIKYLLEEEKRLECILNEEVEDTKSMDFVAVKASLNFTNNKVKFFEQKIENLLDSNNKYALRINTAKANADSVKKDIRNIGETIISIKDRIKELEDEITDLDECLCPVLGKYCESLRGNSVCRQKKIVEKVEKLKVKYNSELLEKNELIKKLKVLGDTKETKEEEFIRDAELSETKQYLAEWRGKAKYAQEVMVRSEEKIKSRVKASNELKDIKSKITANLELAGRTQFLKFMCGKSGIPIGIIKNELDVVEEQCNWILERLDYPKRVKFCAYKELVGFEKVCPRCGGERWYSDECSSCKLSRPRKRKDDPSVTVFDGISERAFNLESGGAKVLQSFAVRLACSMFVAGMTGTRIKMIMLDEIFAMLDSNNRKKLMELIIGRLSTEFGIEQQFVVSHHDDVVNAVDDLLIVSKVGGSSVAVWD